MAATSPAAVAVLEYEARALLTRLGRIQPFALTTPMVGAAAVSPPAAQAIERHLLAGRRRLRGLVRRYLVWLADAGGRGAGDAEAQRRLAFLRLKFNAMLHQLDIFADVLTQRCETENGVWLAGLDSVAADALRLPGRFYQPPPAVTDLARGAGAAIRRARTRLPGGDENPVAVIRIPRERMIGSGIASSLVHEVGHQGAALLGLVVSLRRALRAESLRHQGVERRTWGLWERWISEIVADLWSVARVGVAATQGLIGVVSLPRAFVFRIKLDDPHPFPWIRVKLSTAIGHLLYPHPQWQLLDRLWEAFYPRYGLDPQRLAVIQNLVATMPAFARLLLGHRPRSLRGRALAQAFDTAPRQPARLRALWREWRAHPRRMRQAAPTLVFAALGQAKQDRAIDPETESRTVAVLLRHWAFTSSLTGSELPGAPRPTATTVPAPARAA
jgi:hypothetical protein